MKKAIRIILTIIVVAGMALSTVYLVFEPSFLSPPEAPEGEEPETVADGFYDEGEGWFYFENGEIARKTDIIQGTVNEKTGYWQVVNGMVDFSAVSLEKTENNTWQYIKNGEVTEQTDETVSLIFGEILNSLSGEEKTETFGKFSLSAEEEILLKNRINSVTSKGYELGFVVMNLNTLEGFSYNADERIYSASAIKAPYVVSLVKSDNTILRKENKRIDAILKRSSNFDYESMRDMYGDDCFVDFSSETKNDWVIDTTRNYQYMTPRALAHLWAGSYVFFESGEAGESIGEMFESPVISPIHKIFSDENTTRTKAGWISKNNIDITNDAGIVYTDNGDYLVVIMTTAPCDFSVVETLAEGIKTVIFK